MKEPLLALSIRQPWASLVVHGLKTIEIRRWPVERRGPILIHAAQLQDERFPQWQQLPMQVLATLKLRGGIIGSAELIDCVAYEDSRQFARDYPRHWNRPEWFQPPRLFGFVFARPQLLPFRSCKGQIKLFAPWRTPGHQDGSSSP